MREHSLHATLVRVHGHGVLIQGLPGSGKSTLALQLIHAGHALVADDLVLTRVSGSQLFGQASAQAEGRLAVRGAGIIPVFSVYGPAGLHSGAHSLDWVVTLDPDASSAALPEHTQTDILGQPRPQLRVRAHQDHAALISACCRTGSARLLRWKD